LIDVNHLEFGKGGIGIHMSDTSDVALLVFRYPKKPAPIGRLLSGNRAKEVELLKSDMVMSFTNIESTDALIKCLLNVRRNTF